MKLTGWKMLGAVVLVVVLINVAAYVWASQASAQATPSDGGPTR